MPTLTDYPNDRTKGEPGISEAAESFTFNIDIGDDAPCDREEGVDACSGARVDCDQIHRHHCVLGQHERRMQHRPLQIRLATCIHIHALLCLGKDAEYCNEYVSVCLLVCLLALLKNQAAKLHQIFCALCINSQDSVQINSAQQ